MLSGLRGSHLPLLQIVVYSCCFVRLWWKHFSSARTEKVGCGSTSSQNWTEPSAHLPPRSLWLSDHLFAVICPLSHDAKKKSYFRSTKQKAIDTKEQEKKRCMKNCPLIRRLVVSGLSTLEGSYGQFFKQYGFYFCCIFIVCPNKQPCLKWLFPTSSYMTISKEKYVEKCREKTQKPLSIFYTCLSNVGSQGSAGAYQGARGRVGHQQG